MICEQCNKRIFPWNIFYRKYGEGIEYSQTKPVLRKILICSMDCYKNYIREAKNE